MRLQLLLTLGLVLTSAPLWADEVPTIPVGYDAYRMWDRWHHQRIGARAYMRSTYDRKGANHTADASHFLYQLADDRNVTLGVAGPGMLYFVRYNHWHGSPWHYLVDGQETIVSENSTADPDHPDPESTFLPREAFPSPLTYTWATTKGADLNWVPMGFQKSFQMQYSRTHYGTGYYIYHQFVEGAPLSQPIAAWTVQSPIDSAATALLDKAGTDLVTAETLGDRVLRKLDGNVPKLAGTQTIAEVSQGAGLIRAIKLSVPRAQAEACDHLRIRCTWDNRAAASVEAPLPLFFGTGTFYNRDDKEYLVKALPVSVKFTAERMELAAFFPMPFFKQAKIELLADEGTSIDDVRYSVLVQKLDAPAAHVGYFHATYRDHGPQPRPGHDLLLLDTAEVEGSPQWSGSFIGTSFIFSHNIRLNTLEGDPRFFFDDSESPQAQGTGTEEWGGGGDYWGGITMTLPLAGHPVGAPKNKPLCETDKIESAYRFLLADLMPFGKRARITLEHGATNESKEHYETVTYWYGLPAPSLALSDELHVGETASETAHHYESPQASEPTIVRSRFELGIHHLKGEEIYPEQEFTGRVTKGTSEFTLAIDPTNAGVMLRRTLDYRLMNQRADVFIADASNDQHPPTDGDFQPAGVWYTAGSSTAVFSNPKPELGATEHEVWESDRALREDEFLLPRKLTAGRSKIRVRVRFAPQSTLLFPGGPELPSGWSELRYRAYSLLVPKFTAP